MKNKNCINVSLLKHLFRNSYVHYDEGVIYGGVLLGQGKQQRPPWVGVKGLDK